MAKAKKPALVEVHTLPPGSTFRTPDWPPCKSWPELVKGKEGRVVSHGVGSSLVVLASERLAISKHTGVVAVSVPDPPTT